MVFKLDCKNSCIKLSNDVSKVTTSFVYDAVYDGDNSANVTIFGEHIMPLIEVKTWWLKSFAYINFAFFYRRFSMASALLQLLMVRLVLARLTLSSGIVQRRNMGSSTLPFRKYLRGLGQMPLMKKLRFLS
jgi:hypothetical protein